ncbi:GHMP kinase [Candidatus Woesearchaeota archaeon]|nr:GHMP kinase [Candidatus Woesearchaeota archaeon]
MEEFYKESQGAVLSTTINQFMYISTHNFFDEDKIRIRYSKLETVVDIKKIKHPIVKEVLKKFKINGALEISSNADIPANTGLGSSSSFTVGLLHNLYTKFGKHVTKEQLAGEACDIEINRLKEPIGKQDQYAASFGGLNVIKFNPSGNVNVEPIHLTKDTYQTLQKNLLMFYTGLQRKTSSILKEQKKNIHSKGKLNVLKKMVQLVWNLRDALYQSDLDEFGNLLHQNWQLKKQLTSKISNQLINKIYDKGLKNGAIGGKLLGAGGGGFMLFYCNERNHERLRRAMKNLRGLKFKFDNEGSKLLYIGDEYNY